MALSDIYQKASLVQIPSGYKSGTLYSVVPNTADGDFTVTGDPQGEATRVNKDGLIETVSANVPRLNYDPTSPQDPTLLLEPTRINRVFPNNSLTGYSTIGVSTTNNDAIAPNGTNEGAKVQATSSGTAVVFKGFTGTSGVTHNISAFIKAGTHNQVRLQEGFSASNIDVNLSNGNIIANSNSSNLNVEEYPNNWYRVSFNFTSSGTNLQFALYFNGTYSSGENIYLYGGQIEEGTYTTSLIPTSGSAVTRTVDDFQNNFTGLTSTAGTVFLDFETKGLDSNFARLFAVHDSVTSDGIYLGIYSTNTIGFFGIDGGAGLPDVKDTISFNQRNKLVLTFDGSGNYKYSLNGSLQTGTYTGTSRQYDEIGRGNVIGGSSNNIVINQFMVFNEALTDSELQTLTT
jgi:hypothetical protein